MELELVTYPNEILQTKITEEWDFDNPQYDAVELRDAMFKVMTKNLGIGLSANQVGLKVRAFIFVNNQASNDTDSKALVLNPSWENVSDSQDIDMFESCLSYPGVVLSVNRPARIKAKWTDHHGKAIEMLLHGYTARCFMHEYYHLEGITMDQHVAPVKWKEAVANAEAKKT
jgi:peptide deformylase